MIFVGPVAFGVKKALSGGQLTVFRQEKLSTKLKGKEGILDFWEDVYLLRFQTEPKRDGILRKIEQLKPESVKDFVEKLVDEIYRGDVVDRKPIVPPSFYEDEAAGAGSQHPQQGQISTSGSGSQPAHPQNDQPSSGSQQAQHAPSTGNDKMKIGSILN